MKQIRDAVQTVKEYVSCEGIETSKAVGVLINLAEKVLAVEGKMPLKMVGEDCEIGQYGTPSNLTSIGWNQCLDQCTLAITGALLSVPEINEVVACNCNACFDANGKDVTDRVIDAIHNAQMEKLGGNNDRMQT